MNIIEKDIVLYENQIEHVNSLIKILENNYYAIDLSMLGTGKTYTTSYIYQTLLKQNKIKHIIVISPKSVQTKWYDLEEKFGFVVYKNIGFRTLTGIKFKQPKHELLKRRDYIKRIQDDDGTFRDMEKCEYFCTEEYKKIVNDGVLLVIDEIQNIKNINNQSLACKELIKEININFKNGGKSKLILLSGSPIDKQIQSITLFKSLNIMLNDRLSCMNPQTQMKIYKGMTEIEDYCINLTSKEIVYSIKFPNKSIDIALINYGYFIEEKYCYDLFQKIIKKSFSNAMPSQNNKYTIIKKNSFYNMDDENDLKLLKKGINILQKTCGYDEHINTVNFGIQSLLAIQRAMQLIETSKINLFYKIVREALINNPNYKVVIAVNYIDTINDLMILLKDFNPLQLSGSISTKKRLTIINNFQKDNNDFRLIIANSSVINSGIDLDSKFKGRNRICFLSPNFKTIELYQISGRFIRTDSQENAMLNLVFVKDNIEHKILNSIARKSTIIKETVNQQLMDGVVFPDMYENYFEE